MIASSTFDVTTWEPAGADTPEAGPALSRVRIEKAFEGDVTGTSTGEGLFCGAGDPAAGAGYVVSERITGAIGDREGSFVIQHGGLMGPGLGAACSVAKLVGPQFTVSVESPNPPPNRWPTAC